ncbi:DUF3006 domain-containing protein [Deinococcus taklimakanensis]|uniref:DUF3006 domain-containing protein n=1 Tax=Deinococcus taklimakanensis TaxID=536443 RepID=A0ABW5P3N1_9DEIO
MSEAPRKQPVPRAEYWTVDGIEDAPRGPVARLERESGETFTLPLRDLPGGLSEGDRLAVQDGPDGVTVQLLPEDSARRKQAAREQMEALEAASKKQTLVTDASGEITL